MTEAGNAAEGRRSRWSRQRLGRAVPVAILASVVACVLAACSSGSSSDDSSGFPTTTTIDPAAAIRAQIITAWKAAENAFYQAEANAQGLYSPTLEATMVDPELQMVKAHLAGDEAEGFVGKGSWNLGVPIVDSLGPTEENPTTATVASCINDGQILVNSAGQPATGTAGTPEWIGATSTMIFTSSGWRLSQQSAVANVKRSIACADISS